MINEERGIEQNISFQDNTPFEENRLSDSEPHSIQHQQKERERSRSTSKDKQRYQKRTFVDPVMPNVTEEIMPFREFMNQQVYYSIQKQHSNYFPARALYDTYKKECNLMQTKRVFQEQKNSEWFRDKYLPQKKEQSFLLRSQQAKQKAEHFFKNITHFKNIILSLNEQQINDIKTDGGVIQENLEDNFLLEVIVKDSIDLTRPPYMAYEPNPYTLYIKLIPSNVSQWQIQQHVQQLPGFQNFIISEAVKVKEYNRHGWIEFDSESNMSKAQKHLASVEIVPNYTMDLERSTQQRQQLQEYLLYNFRKIVKVGINFTVEQLKKDLQISAKLIEQLDKEKGIEENMIISNVVEDENFEKQLDLQILYLRKVHSYCYYSASEFANEKILSNKCGQVTEVPHNIIQKKAFFRLNNYNDDSKTSMWQEMIQQIAQKRIKDSCVNILNNEYQKQLETDYCELRRHNNKKNLSVYPCEYENCTKQFQGSVFLLKHYKVKHIEEFRESFQSYETEQSNKKMQENFAEETRWKQGISQWANQFLKNIPNKENNGGSGDKQEKPREREETKEVKEITWKLPLNYVPYQGQKQYRDLDNLLIFIQKSSNYQQQQQKQPQQAPIINYNDI